MDGNIKDTPPIVVLPAAEDRPRWAALQSEQDHVGEADDRAQGQQPCPIRQMGQLRKC